MSDSEIVRIGKFAVAIAPDFDPAIVAALRDGTYENGERNVIPHVLKAGDRVLEVGGAIGAVAMTAADVVGAANVLSFEANPALVNRARQNFELNGLGIRAENAVLQNRVCWAGTGTSVEFYVHKQYWASSLTRAPGTVAAIKVPTRCFEAEARSFGANALVCDIEGGEIGLLELADLSGFNKIVMELHYWAGREATNRMMRKLILDGFSVDFDHTFGSIVTLHRGLLPA